MNSIVNQDENQFLETTQLFLKLLQNPNDKEQILQRFEEYIDNGTFLTHMKRLMDQSNDVSLKLKPLIGIIFKELCNKDNQYISNQEQQKQFLDFLIETIDCCNIDFQIKIILADSLKVLCEQIDKSQLDFIFLSTLTKLMQGNITQNQFEGQIIISDTFLQIFAQDSQNTVVINFIRNVFNESQYKQFLNILDKVLVDQSLNQPNRISVFIFENFLTNLLKYLKKNRMLQNIFKNTVFFQDILQIIENITEPQSFLFRSLYFKVLRQLQKNCLLLDKLEGTCQRKHYFLDQFSEYFYKMYVQYLTNKNSIELHSGNYLKRLLNISISMIQENRWQNNFQDIVVQSFQVIILPSILPTIDELDNPQEFVYYYFDCIDERKSKTLKNLIFALMEEFFVKQPDFLEFCIQSFNYIIKSTLQNVEINIDYLNYLGCNLSLFQTLKNNANIIKAYLILLTNSAFQISERVDIQEDIEFTLKRILDLYLNENQIEDQSEILALFSLFFIYSSDFIFQNNDSYYKKLIHNLVHLLYQKQIPKLLELQLFFMFEKIIEEQKVQIFIKSEIPALLEIMIQKIFNTEMQEFYTLLRKLFSFCSNEIIQNIIEQFLQRISQLVQLKSNDFILGNCLEVLKSLIQQTHKENSEALYSKMDLYFKQFLNFIIENKTQLFKEQLLDIFQVVLNKSNIYQESFEYFLQNLVVIYCNTEAQNIIFQIVMIYIRKFKDKFLNYKQNIYDFIEILFKQTQDCETFTDQNILLLGFLFSLDFFNQDQTVRLFNKCFNLLTKRDMSKQTTYISASVFLKITLKNNEGAEQFLSSNNISIQNFFLQLALILTEKIKISTLFLNKWMNVTIKYLVENYQKITKNLFQNFLLNCLLLNLIQLNQTNLFQENKSQLLFIIEEQFMNDVVYKSLKSIYDKEYEFDNLSDVEEEHLQQLENIGSNLGKFPDHTLEKLTNELLSLNDEHSFDSFEQMRQLIAQLETQQDYQDIYKNQLDEDFQKLIKNAKNFYSFNKNGVYSVRKILKIKRSLNKQLKQKQSAERWQWIIITKGKIFIIIYNFLIDKINGGEQN